MKVIRTMLTVLILAALAAPAWAQRGNQSEFKQKLEEKMTAAWLVNGGWITDYDQARAEAKKSGKLIFTYFTRSYSY